jgi:hypothetical protein
MTQESTVSADPASLVIEKVNRVQILIGWSYPRRYPPLLALDRRCNCKQKKQRDDQPVPVHA